MVNNLASSHEFQQGWEQDKLDKRAQAFLAANGVSLL